LRAGDRELARDIDGQTVRGVPLMAPNVQNSMYELYEGAGLGEVRIRLKEHAFGPGAGAGVANGTAAT
jgi:uncharacterized spore protein YtfJ